MASSPPRGAMAASSSSCTGRITPPLYRVTVRPSPVPPTLAMTQSVSSLREARREPQSSGVLSSLLLGCSQGGGGQGAGVVRGEVARVYASAPGAGAGAA